MASQGPSLPTSVRREHSNAAEAQVSDLSNNFIKMIETLKEELKNFLKEIEEMTKNERNQINPFLKRK